jgi:hypothetical protein
VDPSRLGGNAAHIILIGIHAHHATLRYPCEIATIRDVMTMAAEGDDPWILSAGTIDISFAIIQTGTMTLGVNGELTDELTHTLRLGLTPTST